MPRLDGPGLLSQLRSAEATRDIPVIMVSARAGQEAVAGGLDAGADDYLIKPFTSAELIARVRTQLRTARQRRQAASRIQALSDITGELNDSLDPRQISQTLARHLVPALRRRLHRPAPRRRHRAGHPAHRRPGHARALRVGPGEPAAAPAPGAGSRLSLPLTFRGRRVGTVTLAGLTPAGQDPAERPFLNELVGRAAAALDNAARYQHEHGTAAYLQAAMLSDVPATPGLDSAALYRPAAREDLVGGDWYDCFHIPPRPGREAGTSLAVAIGDITGHDMRAATIMSQVRSMLRQAVLDHPALGPQAAVTALEHAIQALPIDATGTLVLGQLDRQDASWTFTWSNAGHPPPLLCHPDGRTEDLHHHDPMLYPGFAGIPRTQHRRHLAPGTTHPALHRRAHRQARQRLQTRPRAHRRAPGRPPRPAPGQPAERRRPDRRAAPRRRHRPARHPHPVAGRGACVQGVAGTGIPLVVSRTDGGFVPSVYTASARLCHVDSGRCQRTCFTLTVRRSGPCRCTRYVSGVYKGGRSVTGARSVTSGSPGLPVRWFGRFAVMEAAAGQAISHCHRSRWRVVRGPGRGCRGADRMLAWHKRIRFRMPGHLDAIG